MDDFGGAWKLVALCSTHFAIGSDAECVVFEKLYACEHICRSGGRGHSFFTKFNNILLYNFAARRSLSFFVVFVLLYACRPLGLILSS